MLRLGAERPELRVVADQIGAPTWSRTIAEATAHIVAQARAHAGAGGHADWWRARSGVYNLTAGGATSWYGFAHAILDMAMGSDAPTITPIAASAYPVPAKRPANSRMSGRKLADTFGLQLPTWDEALRLCLEG
jgi:dTDP-4-dehydrorhamnose reductase